MNTKQLLSIAAVVAALGTTQPLAAAPEHAIGGLFSVAANKQVYFSQGNLQYTQSTKTWSFAEEQYNYIGSNNITANAKIDLFGFSGDATNATPWGAGITTSSNFKGNFKDWGQNSISGDAANTWRTLSYEEWEYLLSGRTNADKLWGIARIQTNNSTNVCGLIFLPNDYLDNPADVSFTAGSHSYSSQTFTLAQWKLLEAKGAVFLPAAGMWEHSIPDKPIWQLLVIVC